MRALGLSLLVVALGLTIFWYVTDGIQALTTEGARRLTVERDRPTIADAQLTTMDGNVVRLRPPPGKIAMVEFIYTTCPTLCQEAAADLSRVRDKLVQLGLGDKVKIYSISFDLDIDQVEQLQTYGEFHNADGAIWTITRPRNQDLPKLLETFGVTIIPDEFGGYEHNAAIHLIDEQSRMFAIVDTDDIDAAVTAAVKAVK